MVKRGVVKKEEKKKNKAFHNINKEDILIKKLDKIIKKENEILRKLEDIDSSMFHIA
jgi:hypothetical protein